MKNKDAFDRIEDLCGPHIQNLYWIAASNEAYEFKEMLEDLDEMFWERMFPEIYNSDEFKEYGESERLQLFFDFKKLGFIAEIHVPEKTNFKFDEDGKVSSCSISMGICHVDYVYAETTEGLISKIEKSANSFEKEDISKFKRTTDHG